MTVPEFAKTTPSEGGSPSPPGILFTDLDGTLLDHDTYDFEPAATALAAARQASVPVVLCSSKTRAEMLAWQTKLGLSEPFIVENGGAVFLPSGDHPLSSLFPDRWDGLPAKVFGIPYEKLRGALAELRRLFGLPVRGFGDMTTAEIEALTQLPPEDAERARRRDFDEPFLWLDEPDEAHLDAVRTWLSRRRLQVLRGGRLWHLVGGNDKGGAVRWLLGAYEQFFGRKIASLALGDSENDLPMLHAADCGILVERKDGHLSGVHPGILCCPGLGPVGWSRAVHAWLTGLQKSRKPRRSKGAAHE